MFIYIATLTGSGTWVVFSKLPLFAFALDILTQQAWAGAWESVFYKPLNQAISAHPLPCM